MNISRPTFHVPRPTFFAWLELLRVPNLPTVPGDPLAGFALASVGREPVEWVAVLPLVGVSVLLYMAGLIWNDCADLDEDRRERPARPIPSGRVSRRQASVVATLFAALAIGLAATVGRAALAVALLLLVLVLTYTFWARRLRLLGLLNMGACRGVSLLLGASAFGAPAGWPVIAAVGIGLYIAGVAWLAVDETKRAGPPINIGLLIRLLIPIQAVLCVAGGASGTVVAGLVLLGWPVSTWLGKRFYAS